MLSVVLFGVLLVIIVDSKQLRRKGGIQACEPS